MKRGKVLLLVFALILVASYLAIITESYHIQVVEHNSFLKRSERSAKVKMTVIGKRGAIYDRSGEPLALSEPKLDLWVDPKSIGYKREMAGVLAEITGEPVQKLYTVLTKNRHYALITRDAPYDWQKLFKRARKKAVRALSEAKKKGVNKQELQKLTDIIKDFRMVRFEFGYKRVYPQQKLLSNVLGFVRRSDLKGLDGLEYRLNSLLTGKTVTIERFKNAVGKQAVREVKKEMKNNSGKSVYLTIDSRIQYIAEKELAAMVEKVHARWGCVTIMNPADGKIIALANYPNYLPAQFYKTKPNHRRNYAVANLFEPGSTMKVFSILSVLNHNLVKPGELIYGENGLFRFGHRTIHDHEKLQWLTVKDIVVHSSNIGTVKLADRLTKKELYDSLVSFGFGEKSGIDISGESYSPLRSYKKWYPIDKANIAFGQGVMVNSLQMVRAFAAIYNNGVLWKPRIVDKIVDVETGKELFHSIPEPDRVTFRYNSNKKMADMLEAVVEEGTARRAHIPGVSVGGKTGTSQKYDSSKHRYSWKRVVASFIGAVPNENPAMIMMVVIDEPEGREFGGSVAAPVFREVAKQSLPLLGIYLPKESEVVKKNHSRSVNLDSDMTDFIPDKKKMDIPEGFVVMPTIEGLTLKNADVLLREIGLEIVYPKDDNLRITKQSPAPKDIVPVGTVVTYSVEEKEE